MGYNFDSISDHEFEELAADLLSAELGVRFEVFTQGPDGGVDLRCLLPTPKPGSKSIIVQCKKWKHSNFVGLRSNLKLVELPKVAFLKPDRYIVVTSVGLTPANKQILVADLHPWIKSPDDVFGYDDLSLLIRKNQAVERRHIKLWLTSTEMLDSIVHAATLSRSSDLVERLPRQLKYWVPNPSFERAQDCLRNNRVVIISGPPGIGKTMLAEVLLASYSKQGFSPIAISEDIAEAEAAIREKLPQAFYYDDFLGRISLGELVLRKNEDARLALFVDRISRSSNKLLILTTREYILRDAVQRYERLDPARIDRLKTVVDLTDYNRLIRAKILYNHLYFSDLSPDLVCEIASPEVYRKIIGHSNYSPRIIDQAIDVAALDRPSPKEFGVRLLAALSNPALIWKRIFENLDGPCRSILLIMATMPPQVEVTDLHTSAAAFDEGVADYQTFLRCLAIMEGTFLQIDTGRNAAPTSPTRFVRYRDPSVADFVWGVLADSSPTVDRLITCAMFFEQIMLLLRGRNSAGVGRAVRDGAHAARRAIELLSAPSATYLHAMVGNVSTWHRNAAIPEERLAAMTNAWPELSAAGAALSSLRAALLGVSREWGGGRRSKLYALALLNATKGVSGLANEHRIAVEQAAVWFQGDLHEVEDFDALAKLAPIAWKTTPPVKYELETAASQFEELLEQGGDALSSHIDDPDDLEELIAAFDRVGMALEIDTDDVLDEIRARLEEALEERERHSPDEDEYERTSGGSNASEDRYIEQMFSGLR